MCLLTQIIGKGVFLFHGHHCLDGANSSSVVITRKMGRSKLFDVTTVIRIPLGKLVNYESIAHNDV